MQIILFALLGGLVLGVVFISIAYLKKRSESKADQEKYIPTTQDQFPVDSIRDRIIKLKTGGYRLVIEVPSINIDLMENSEKEGVLELYKEVLSSIDFSFQYLQQSRIVDISDYLTTLSRLKRDAKTNFIQNQLEFYSQFLVDLIKSRSILTKKFYIVIPYDEEKEKSKLKKYSSLNEKKDKKKKNEPQDDVYLEEQRYEKARKQLLTRAGQIISALRGLEIDPVVLKDNEILELFYTSYNKDRAVYQPIRDIDPKDYTSLNVEYKRREDL